MRNSDEEPFHYKASISQVIEHRRRSMLAEIAKANEAQIKPDTEGVAAKMAEAYSINMPALDEQGIKPEIQDIDIDISRDPSRLPFHMGRHPVVKGTQISITVPFQGDRDVFRLHASSHTMDYPRGLIGGSKITFVREGVNLDAAKVRQEFDSWLATIKRHLASMQAELGNFNERLQAEAKTAVQHRLEKFNRDNELLNGLGFGAPKSK